MSYLLQWSSNGTDVCFRVLDQEGTVLQVSDWGSVRTEVNGRPASTAPLLALLANGTVRASTDQSVNVSHGIAAHWDRHQVRQLGLPDVAPFRLSIRGQGILTSPSFRFIFQLQDHRGRPMIGGKRQGMILSVGQDLFTLLNPLYALIEGLERFNAAHDTDIDARFEAWGALKVLLPEDAIVDGQLRSMNIARADALTLDTPMGDDFDPVLLARPRQSADDSERGEAAPLSTILPTARQRDFAEGFRRFEGAQRRYAVTGNWYLMIPEDLRSALQVVRDIQGEPAEQRRAFLADPHAILKERLAGKVSGESIDDLFEETPSFLSARVRCLGEWNPKAHAFVTPSGIDWMPLDEGSGSTPPFPMPRAPESRVGVPTRAGLVQVAVKDVPEVIERIRVAMAEGREFVEWQGQHIPADRETSCVFEALAGSGNHGVQGPGLVPLILDNLDTLDYSPGARRSVSHGGGLPAALRSRLFPHQVSGLKWLQAHWSSGSPGALLADDMGLGKTIQTLAFMAWVQEQADAGSAVRKPQLVVAPTGLLRNWEAEAEIHLASPGLGRLVRAYGPELARLGERTTLERRSFLQDQVDWVLTTYETLRDKIRLFVDVPWRVVVFDEAQRIKNPAARVTDMAKSLDAELTLALTGTPVENSLSDLWCIVDAVQPGFLGAHGAFRDVYGRPAVDDPDALVPLKDKLEHESNPALLLRRMKEDHLQGLPEKHTHVEQRPMSRVQADAYDRIVGAARSAVGQAGGMLEALQGLRRVSLLPEDPGDEGLTDRHIDNSARLTALVEILDGVHTKGEKALVFLEFLGLQADLIPYLRQRYGMTNDPICINGSTPGPQRKRHVDAFQCRPEGSFDVMVLSPKAAGVGLTLTAANHVIHLSRWWNPAVEDQCTDRAYRIGQSRDVHVYYPLAVHPSHGDRSFDQNLHRLLEKKRGLSRSVLAPVGASDADRDRLFADSVQ